MRQNWTVDARCHGTTNGYQNEHTASQMMKATNSTRSNSTRSMKEEHPRWRIHRHQQILGRRKKRIASKEQTTKRRWVKGDQRRMHSNSNIMHTSNATERKLNERRSKQVFISVGIGMRASYTGWFFVWIVSEANAKCPWMHRSTLR